MTFETYKKALCKKIYTVDICSGNKILANNMFNYKDCKVPVFGIADLLYLASTAANKTYLKARIENFKGYSRFLAENKQRILKYLV